MNQDAELENWRREWQSETAVPADLRRRVELQSRWLKIGIAADTLVTVVIGGGVLALATRLPQRDMIVLAAATWIFLAAAWTFRLVSHRGLWSPSAQDTAAFVDLLIRRCKAKLAATVFGGALYLCEIGFCLVWIYRHSGPRASWTAWLFFSSLPMDAVWLVTFVFLAGLIWYRRKKRAELVWLLTLRDSA
jgi:hypothetical protein